MTKAQQKHAGQLEAIAHLRTVLKPGDTVYTVLRHVSASGMLRRIDIYKMVNNEPWYLTGYVARANDYRRSDKGGLVITGCGMDMGFAVVYNLSRTLFPKGFKLPKGKHGRNGDKSGFDTDGGYALKQAWL
jgi:hypothetical protein